MGIQKTIERSSNTLRAMFVDMVLSCLWVMSSAMVKMTARQMNAGRNEEYVRWVLIIAVVFVFAWLSRTTGGSFNPVTVLTRALSAKFMNGYSFFTVVARVAAEAFGSFIGVVCVKHILTEPGLRGHMLKVSLKTGMAVEGCLTFVVVIVRLVMGIKGPRDFLMATWITSIVRLSLVILGADFTGAAMNPASAFGWAYWRGDHATREHIFVYWLAPLEAMLLAFLIFRFLALSTQKKKDSQEAPRKTLKTE